MNNSSATWSLELEPADHSSVASAMMFPTGDACTMVMSSQSMRPEQGPFYSVGFASAGVGGGSGAAVRGVVDGMMGTPEQQLEQKAFAGTAQWPPSQAALAAWQTAGNQIAAGDIMSAGAIGAGAEQHYGPPAWGFQPQCGFDGPFMTNSPSSNNGMTTSTPSPDLTSSSSSSQENNNNNNNQAAMRGGGRATTAGDGGLAHMYRPHPLPGVNLGLADSLFGPGAMSLGGGVNLGSLGYPPYGVGGGAAAPGVGGMARGYGHTPVPLPGIELYSPQLAAQKVMSEGRTGASATSHIHMAAAEEKKRQPVREEEPQSTEERELTPKEKLERSRLRNRDHSRKSRQRKKALVEGMKKQVTELGAYRMLVEQAHDLISAHTANDRAFFMYASGAFSRLLGIDPQDLIGVPLTQIINPNDVPRVMEAIRSALLCSRVAQVRYGLIYNDREHTVETSFRMVPTRLLAVTRVNGVSFLPSQRR